MLAVQSRINGDPILQDERPEHRDINKCHGGVESRHAKTEIDD